MTTRTELQINHNTFVSKTSKFLIIKEEIDENILTSKILKKSITGHNLTRKNKSNIQLWWVILGLIVSILTWQLSTEAFISIYGSIILVLISLFLYVDYIFQKGKIVLGIFFNGNGLNFVVEDQIEEIEEFFNKLY